MIIEEINPYVRFAMSYKYPSRNIPLIAYDTHIYYITSGSGQIISYESEYKSKSGYVDT